MKNTILYSNIKSCVMDKGKMSGPFPSYPGVRQAKIIYPITYPILSK